MNLGFRMQGIGTRAQPPAEAVSLIPFAHDFARLPLDQPALIGVRTRGYADGASRADRRGWRGR